MMRLEIDRSDVARGDLVDIWDYVSPNSPKGASRILGEIYATFSMLADTPGAGRQRPELAAGMRSFPVAGYLVFYRYNTSILKIIRVLHAARDITPDLLSE